MIINRAVDNALITLSPQSESMPNQLGDDCFLIQEPLDGKFYTVSFQWNCSMSKRVFAQKYFLESDISRGYADDKGRIVVSSLSSARQELAYLRDLCEYWESYFPDRALQSLSRLEMQTMYRYFMVRKDNTKEAIGVLGLSTMVMLSKILDRTHTMVRTGKLSDGTSHQMTDSFRKTIMEPLLIPLEIEYSEWKKGGSYGSIPMTCASIMLAEAITLIESEEAKIAVIFFRQWRALKSNIANWFGSKDRLALYRRIQSPSYTLTRFERDWAESAIEMGKAIDNATTASFDRLPWNTIGELTDYCQLLSKACVTTIALLSGFRIHEIQGMKINDYSQDPDGSWWFNSENNKTESGFSHPRSLHGLAADAANLMKGITVVDTDKFNLPLIHGGYRDGAFQIARGWGKIDPQEWLAEAGYSTGSLSRWFKDFYQTYVVEKHPEAGKIHSAVSPHQARHTFAEFALRRFDGNVMEKIREHFRHSHGSFHTRRYTGEKLKESIRMSMERDYLKEVMGRISVGSLDDRFYGPAARRIDKEMAEISIFSADEFEAHLNDLANQFVRFTAFEWGYCALRQSEQNIAKCHDPATGIPNVDQRSAPEICAGCPHSMNNNLQKHELERIAISHQFIAENHPLKSLGKISFEVVRKISKRLDEGVAA